MAWCVPFFAWRALERSDCVVQVLSLELPNNNLQGPLTDLPTTIQTLNLNGNHLHGHMPASLFENATVGLGALKVLDLSDNDLEGSIPSFAAPLTNLVLSKNKLTRIDAQLPFSLRQLDLRLVSALLPLFGLLRGGAAQQQHD